MQTGRLLLVYGIDNASIIIETANGLQYGIEF